MYKKSLVLLLVLTLVLAAFAGCSKKETVSRDDLTEPQIVRYNYGANPETLDPAKVSENVGIGVLYNTFEGLTRLDENDKGVAGVAEKWDISDDNTVYTFHLRDNAKWSDGKPVTAHDFVYAWKRALNPEMGSDYAYILNYLKNGAEIFAGKADYDTLGVEAKDDKTLVVTLEEPIGWILELFAFPTFYPVREDIVKADPDTWAADGKEIVSNGPFTVKIWKDAETIEMVRNENYWNADEVLLDKFIGHLIVEESTALAGFEAGDLDGIDHVPVPEIPRLLSESDEFEILPDLGLYYYVFNNEAPPFDNEDVRKAFSIAIDRKAICKNVTMGGEKAGVGLVPYGINYGGKDFREGRGTYDIDPEGAKVEEAQKLLADAGYPNGEGLPPIKLNYNDSERHKLVAQAVQEMWKQNLGAEVELAVNEWGVHLDTLEQGNYQVARIGWGADYVHPMTFLDMWITGSENNYSNYFNTEFDSLIKKAKSAPEKEAAEYLQKAEDIFMSRHTIAPIYFATEPELIKSYVKGWRKNAVGIMFMNKAYVQGKEE